MTDVPSSLADLAAEEEELQFTHFTNDDAWELGSALVAAARAQGCAGRDRDQPEPPPALPRRAAGRDARTTPRGSSARPASSTASATARCYMRQASVETGTTFEEEFGLDPRCTPRTGAPFPVIVRSVGPVGVVVVSGLPQLEDHQMVVAALRAHLAAG